MSISLHLPQILYIALNLIGLGLCAARSGEPKTGKHSFTSDLIATSLVWALLIWGGFFAQ